MDQLGIEQQHDIACTRGIGINMKNESMALVVAVNDPVVLESTLIRSSIVQQDNVSLVRQEGYASASLAYNDALADIETDIVVFVHQDVYLPREWESQVRLALSQEPRAAVLGVFGIDSQQSFHGRVWSQGLRAELDFRVKEPTRVCALDELVLVVRADAGLRFDPDLPGYHLYGADIAQRALQAGYRVVVFDGPVIHNSSPVRSLDRTYEEAYTYMQQRWARHLPIQTCTVPISADGEALSRWHDQNRRRQWSRRARALFRPHRRLVDPRKKALALGYELP